MKCSRGLRRRESPIVERGRLLRVSNVYLLLFVCNPICLVSGMMPNFIPEAPGENAPDRRDAPPLPMAPLIKTNQRFFRPAPRTFVEGGKGTPPLPVLPKGSLPADFRSRLGGAVSDENLDRMKKTQIIRTPTHILFDVEEPARLAAEDEQRKSSYAKEGELLKEAMNEEKKDYETSLRSAKESKSTGDAESESKEGETNSESKE